MTKIYIDTNIFLDFYQAASDRLAVFKELHELCEHIVLTEQTVREFRRNRIARLIELVKNIKGSSSNVSIRTTSVVRELPGFKEWAEARDCVQSIASDMIKKVTAWLADERQDPVLIEFEKLEEKCRVLATNRVKPNKGTKPTTEFFRLPIF